MKLKHDLEEHSNNIPLGCDIPSINKEIYEIAQWLSTNQICAEVYLQCRSPLVMAELYYQDSKENIRKYLSHRKDFNQHLNDMRIYLDQMNKKASDYADDCMKLNNDNVHAPDIDIFNRDESNAINFNQDIIDEILQRKSCCSKILKVATTTFSYIRSLVTNQDITKKLLYLQQVSYDMKKHLP